jgi:hypothetical protein
VHVKGRFAFSRGYGEDFCFAVFAVLVVNSSVSGLFVDSMEAESLGEVKAHLLDHGLDADSALAISN